MILGRGRLLRVFLGLSIGLILFPELDLWLSSHFYDYENQNWVARSYLMHFARTYFPRILLGIVALTVLGWLISKTLQRQQAF